MGDSMTTQERTDGPIRQAIGAVGARLQQVDDKIIFLEEALKPAMCSAPPAPEEKNPVATNPGVSELSNRLWAMEEHLVSQIQSLDRLANSLEI